VCINAGGHHPLADCWIKQGIHVVLSSGLSALIDLLSTFIPVGKRVFQLNISVVKLC